jgi:hypothetical protein
MSSSNEVGHAFPKTQLPLPFICSALLARQIRTQDVSHANPCEFNTLRSPEYVSSFLSVSLTVGRRKAPKNAA